MCIDGRIFKHQECYGQRVCLLRIAFSSGQDYYKNRDTLSSSKTMLPKCYHWCKSCETTDYHITVFSVTEE